MVLSGKEKKNAKNPSKNGLLQRHDAAQEDECPACEIKVREWRDWAVGYLLDQADHSYCDDPPVRRELEVLSSSRALGAGLWREKHIS